ncbi:MAG: nucleotide sugar dehydrogenase, partial [Solobacterium sp.]|nr:nucleotide sugar dehydrogenase [Solobacterium sp.]
MSVYDSLVRREKILCVIGLGYVGMPLAIAFSEKVNVIGFDINQEKIRRYQEGSDPTMEVGDERIRNSEMVFSSDESVLDDASFFIVAVPTPINNDKTPDLNPVLEASRIVGKHLKPGDFVVYESTVYPGCTEEKCIPVLEKQSNLKCGTDFRVGY